MAMMLLALYLNFNSGDLPTRNVLTVLDIVKVDGCPSNIFTFIFVWMVICSFVFLGILVMKWHICLPL